MAAVQRLFRAAASGGAATAASMRRMTSLATEQAPSAAAAAAATGFPFKAEEKLTRRPAAERNVQWVFLGCPGVGKGTYASRLSRLLGVPHIATGDLVRDELTSTGPLAKQEILDEVTDIDMVVNLKLREDVLVEKCLGRRICNQCGKNFNLACIDVKGENGLPAIYMAPLLPPNNCMSKLITRADDTEDVVRNRLKIYSDMSQPVEDFYQKQGKLLEFDLPGGIPESWPKLLHVLNLEDQEELKLAAA
ncbi:hypothetical protein PR202_gb18467 [Eleusine coracana subsp. coracana]|uniref:adenylate kinase n=1 Tax=Eleusine coracana subsp. coracana TaxID=191504 RepID=A0AAV5F7G4_ELECO|nr:hypothetical protein PR202_gb18467 [Eleusine coracana subsp. coracana]